MIFDDIERISPNLSFISLLGYFNQLFLCGVKIICSFSFNIWDYKPDVGRQKDFELFKEKVFDRIYSINSENKQAFINCLSELETGSVEPLIPIFNNNLRDAFRSKKIYKSILSVFSEKNVQFDKIMGKDLLLECCCLADRIIFGHNEEQTTAGKINDESDKLAESLIAIREEQLKEKYGNNIAIGLSNFFETKENRESKYPNQYEPFVEAIISYYLYKDFASLILLFDEKGSDSNLDILNRNIYFFSDDGKIEFYTKFMNEIKTGNANFLEPKFSNAFISILQYYDNVTEEDLGLAEKKAVKDFKDKEEKLNDFIASIQEAEKNLPLLRIGQIKQFTSMLEEDIKSINVKLLINDFLSFYHQKEFLKMDNILFANSLVKEKEFKDFLIANDFFLPDLSSNLLGDDWDYSHTCAKYAANNGLDKSFEYVLRKQVNSHINSKSCLEKAKALVLYNINRDPNYDFLKEK